MARRRTGLSPGMTPPASERGSCPANFTEDTSTLAGFRRKGGQIQPEQVAEFNRNHGRIAPEYAN